jgi:hypothetical protein
MAALPASEPFPGGLIRSFELLTASDRPRNVLVWIEQAEIVVKDAAALAHPHDGIHHLPITDIRDVHLADDPAGAVLSIRTEAETLRFRGATAVMDGFVNELATLTSDVIHAGAPTPPGRFQRFVARFAGI